MATWLAVLPTSTTSTVVTEIPGGVVQAQRSQIAPAIAVKVHVLVNGLKKCPIEFGPMHFGMVAMYRSSVKRADIATFPLRIAAAIQFCVVAIVLVAPQSLAQESAPVTIDASPMATELLRRAKDSAATNPAESARSLQEAVDRFPNKLVPWNDSADRFLSTPTAAEQFLLDNPPVLQSWLRAESAAAQRRFDQGEVLQVAELRAFTPAGLQSMFTLAQQALDQGRVTAASHWIEKALSHPSLEPAQKKLLDQAMRDIAPDNIPAHVVGDAMATQQEIAPWRPLWSEWLPESWLNRSFAEMDSKAITQAQANAKVDGSALVAKASFTGDGVLIADGASVRLLDRLSGVTRWQRSVSSPTDRANLAPSDLAVAVCAGDTVVTLPGHALSDQRSGAQAKITAISLKNGSILWEVHLDRLGHVEFSELFPHGDPVILDDVVIVQARKSNSRLESAAWLIALDLQTGALRWANSLGAAGGVRLTVSRPLSSPTQFKGDVIAATSLGVVARIDASNGHIIWLRRWTPPLREPRSSNPAWQLPSPVVANDCVFWIAPDQNTLVCMRALDGSTKWSTMLGVSEQLPAARALLADHERLYLLCEDVVAVDIEDPRHTLWKLSSQLNEHAAVRGECALATDENGLSILAVPLQKKAILLDPVTGHVTGELPLEAGGNLALQNGQLIVVGAQQISLSMQATQGERLLRARLIENSNDPRSGLALFEFGRSWARQELMLEGATSMANAINQNNLDSTLLRDEIIGKLLAVLTMKEIDQATQAKLLSITKSCARSSAQQAAVALRVGDLAAEQDQWPEALEQWVAILESKEIANEMVGDEPLKTSAKVAALERILSQPQTATMSLRKKAADNALQSMQTCDALTFMNAVNIAALLACTPADAHRVSQEAALRARNMGWLDFEKMCVAMNASDSAGVSWPSELSPENFPKLGSAQPLVTTLAGRLLAMDPQAQRERTNSSVLFAEPSSLLLRSAEKLDIVWRSNLGDRDPSVMAMLPNIVFWCPQSHEDGALFALNPTDGAPVWRVDSVAALFDPQKLASVQLPTALDRAEAAAIVCSRSGPVCALIRTNGEVIGVNNTTGATQWQTSCVIHDVDAIETSSTLVAVAGLEVATHDELASNPTVIQLVNSFNGATVAQRVLPEEWGRIRWLRILPDCLLIATDEVIAALELAPHLPTRWSQHDRRYKDAPPAQIAGSLCFIRERSGNSAAFNMATGRVNPLAFISPPSGEWETNLKLSQPILIPFHNQWIALRTQRLGLYGSDGALQGADAVAVDRRYENVILGQSTVYVVDTARPEIVEEYSSGLGIVLREFRPADGLRAVALPIPVRSTLGRIAKTDAIDGWIFIGGDDKTMAIPAPLSH